MIPTLIIVAVLVVGFIFFSQIYADVLWYKQLGYLGVFVTENVARTSIFLIAGIVMAVVMYITIRIAYRARPIYAPDSTLQDNLNRYQATLEPVRRLVMIAVPVVFGLFAGAAAGSAWKQVLLFFNQVPFGTKDPEFHLDFSFYVFTLPFLGFLIGYLVSVTLIAGIAGILTHYLYGGIRLEERGLFTSTAARIHIAVFAAIFLLLQAGNFWLDRYGTLQSNSGKWSGALYTDVHAVIPTKSILAVAAVIVAILFIVTAVVGRWRLPLIGTAMLIVTAILASGVYPWVVQRFQVEPTEQAMEKPYIERNIKLTRQAYGLDDVKVTPYNATVNAAAGALRKDAATTANIRLLDPNLISPTFRQLQQFRPYYQFADKLNVDRYNIDGEVKDTVIGVRELNSDGLSGWFNRHIVYTHGYGVVAAYGSEITSDGKPKFMLSGIPTHGVLGSDKTYQPRIYFGKNSPEYSVVGAPKDAAPLELDRPADEKSQGEAKTTFRGDGGPNVGSFFNRIVYSIKFQSSDLLLSDAVNPQSQILYDRNPRARVEKVAPYLTVDGNVYPALVDGRVKWVVDGYTTSKSFPYSTPQQLDSATRDTLTQSGRVEALPAEPINYIRNAVKATVDAYDGSVTLYAWDDQDPVLKAWQSVFPSTVKPYSDMSAELMSHVRYPEDLFKVQRELLGRYHVTDVGDFYQNNDEWKVPADPTVKKSEGKAEVKQPPYYLSLKMPKQDDTAFSLTTPFIPQDSASGQSRNVLYGFLAADGDAGSKKGVKSKEYGTLRLLELPRSTAVPGPGQAQNMFDSDATVSNALNLLRQGASSVLNGNLLTLPVGGGILYVQPLYLQSTGETSYPVLQAVLVAFGDKIGFAPTLDAALDEVFQGDSGASAGDAGNTGKKIPTTPTAPDKSGAAKGSAQAQLNAALQDASQALKAGNAALKDSNFAAYGKAQKELQAALDKALAAQAKVNGGTSATQSPAPSPTTSPQK